RQRIATVAAPGYLAGRALPRTPADLVDHRCLNARLGGAVYRWEYSHKGRDLEVDVAGPLLTNDGDILLAAVRAGAGIACAFERQVQDDLDAGRLVPLLKAWWPSFGGFYLYHPSRAHIPRKLGAFIEFMQRHSKA
ncbi:MAG: LysR family transcriptional regulator, partial [Comamonadaceae bacterium]